MGFWGAGVGEGPARVGSGEGAAEGRAGVGAEGLEGLQRELGPSARLVLQPVGFRLFLRLHQLGKGGSAS